MQDWSPLWLLATWQQSTSWPGPGMPGRRKVAPGSPTLTSVRTMTRGYGARRQDSTCNLLFRR
jgi:hypothetical protein